MEDSFETQHAAAIKRERDAWELLHLVKSKDELYVSALADWRAAADALAALTLKKLDTQYANRKASPALEAPRQAG
jgi:hypothetical protein